MINEGLLKDYNIGKDGFIWWLGQVCEAKTWQDNYPCLPVDSQDELPGFKRRVKVRILGSHTSDKNALKNDELPWAYCLLPVTAGGGTGGASESLNFTGGEWVFGFFLDGEDGQQPVILAVLDKSAQNDWADSVPSEGFKPFSGFSNKRVVPLTDQKKDKVVKKQPVGEATTKVGDTGLQRTKTEPVETVRIEADRQDIRPKASETRHDNLQATGDMTAADNSDCDNAFGGTEKVMKRMSRIETFVQKHDGIMVDGSQNKLFGEAMKREQKRAQRIIAGDQKTQANKMRAATIEAASKMMSNVATFGKLADMAKVKNDNVDAIGNIVGQFTSMIDKMPASAGDFIKQSANKIVSQPPCVTESYVGGLMGQNVAALDGAMNNLMGPVNKALSAASGGSFPPNLNDTIGGLLTGGLNAFGGMSIDLDGIATFSTSYSKMLKGDKPIPCTPVRDMNILDGGLPEAPSEIKGGNILEDLAAKIPTSDQLTKGSTNFLKNNSIFSTAINSDNLRLEALGGVGGVKDALGLARNLPTFKQFPAGTGDSILNIATSFLEQGDTLDAAALAAERVFPGGRELVKQAFDNQLNGQRLAGGSCETGPTQNGPPLIKIFGGSGNGATANAVIGAAGNVLAVDLTRPGKGFTEPPFCVVADNSGTGRGAVIKANLDYDNPDKNNNPWTYQIKDIDVLEPGSKYMQAPDGSIGGNGRKFADANHTMIKDKEGNYYHFEPGTGIKIPPGGIVYLPVGASCSLPVSTIKTNGEPLAPLAGSNIVDYAAIRLMHNFDMSAGRIIPGRQGAEGKGKPGFGRGIDLPAAREAGFKDHDIRFFLQGDPIRGQQSYFIKHMNGAIGRNMQKLLDDPNWGALPLKNSAGKLPGRIKSIQINLKKGFKGFAKVTDGSRLGAGPILSLRDAMTDRKISNILEVQTGNFLNINPEVGGNTEILNLFKEQELRAINGTPIEQFGRFGTAGLQTWEQTKLGADGSRISIEKTDKNYRGEQEWVRKWYIENLCREPDKGGMEHWLDHLRKGKTREEVSAMMKVATPEYVEVQQKRASGKIKPNKCQWKGRVLGGGQRKNILGENYRTLDPWLADLADGTRLTFRGVYNHNTGLTKDQMKNPYDLSRNHYRYFIFDYDVEVYSTPQGYDYTKAGSSDPVKTKWYRLLDIKYVTGTEDWFDGEVVKKRMNDKAGRLYEMYITICTYNDETATAIGQGLATNAEVMEIIKTPLPCESPKLTGGKYCDFQKVRWFREMHGKRTFGEQWGHIPGSERSNLIREIVKVYNEVGDDDKKRFTDYHNAEPYKDARRYVDKKGLEAQVAGYLRQLARFRKGESCDREEYTIPAIVGKSSYDIVYENLSGVRKAADNRLEYDDNPGNGFDVNASLTIESTTGGVTAKFTQSGRRLIINGTGTVTIKYNWNDSVNISGKSLDSLTIGDTKWTQLNVKKGSEVHTLKVNSVSRAAQTKSRYVKVTPLTEDEYQKYKNDFNEIEPRAFACLKRNIWKGFMQAARTAGPIVLEQTYCDWARQYVEEVRTSFQESSTIGYELPCGGEITAPRVDPLIPPVTSSLKVVKPKQVKINTTGSGYTPRDKILIDGEDVPFKVDPNGRIITVTPPSKPVLDYPEIDIITDTGAGADLEVLLQVEEPPEDPALRPLEMIEVIDCVGKNIFIKES